MSRLKTTKSSFIDVVVSHLRAQIVTLHNVLETMERSHSCDDEYVSESFKAVETELRRLRRFIETENEFKSSRI